MSYENAGPFGLVESVAYQDGSVVSKSILNRPAGSITLFAFDQGQELREHTAPFDVLLQIVEGEAEITLSGQPHRLTAGQALLMAAKAPHAVKAVQRFKMLLVMLKS